MKPSNTDNSKRLIKKLKTTASVRMTGHGESRALIDVDLACWIIERHFAEQDSAGYTCNDCGATFAEGEIGEAALFSHCCQSTES